MGERARPPGTADAAASSADSTPELDGRLQAFVRNRWTELRALVWLLVVRIGLAVSPFPKVLELVERAGSKGAGRRPVKPIATVDRISRSVTRASRLVPGAKCLAQSMAGQILLARHGIPSQLKVGVARKGSDQLRAHAWLEQDGHVVFGESSSDVYTPLSRTERNEGS